MLTSKDRAQYYPLTIRHARKEPETQLEKDIAAAKAAGMSYGQYKALNPTTTPPKTKKEAARLEDEPIKKTIALRQKVHTKTCRVCGLEFKSGSNKALYCSDACGKKARYNAKKARKETPPRIFRKVCPVCGEEFATESNQRVYCNALCRYRANNNPARRYDRG